MNIDRLLKVERWIEQLVEEPFVRLFNGRLLPQDVVKHLVLAMEDGERVGADGTPEVPGYYRIDLHPDDLAALRRHHPDLDTRLAEALATLVERMDLRLKESPKVLLRANQALGPRGVLITAADRTPPPATETQDLDVERITFTSLQQQEEEEARAYLIIQGKRTFDLTEPVITIGRALDNDIILEERHISRYHAQLRRRYGKYILQNLSSSSGTSVNGFPIQEIVLRPGDVITLPGIDLIYAESEPLERQARGNTLPFKPADD
jgi:hypothetical protein